LPPSGITLQYAICLLLPGIVVGTLAGRRVRKGGISSLTILLLMVMLTACSGVSNGGGGGSTQATPPGSYTITVTGRSQNPSATHSANVTLVVN
jgi:hypothetical protein